MTLSAAPHNFFSASAAQRGANGQMYHRIRRYSYHGGKGCHNVLLAAEPAGTTLNSAGSAAKKTYE